mmetsp:Transcript_7343/g.18406  ORF Transcript_7343/g.18406 Transcript_7343/m.18406 type:complete len:606 (-) Transcript_7343:205-2022(-)
MSRCLAFTNALNRSRSCRRRCNSEEAAALAPGVTREDRQADGSHPTIQVPPRRRSCVTQRMTAIELKLRSTLQKSWWSGVSGPARQEIQEALDLLLNFDIDDVVGRADSTCSSGTPTRGSNWTNGRHSHDPLASLLDEGAEEKESDEDLVPLAKTMTENRRWLVQTFTQADIHAAAGHEAGLAHSSIHEEDEEGEEGEDDLGPVMTQVSSVHRYTAQELDACLLNMLSPPDAVPLLRRVGQFDFDTLAFYDLAAINRKPLQYLGAHLLQSNNLVRALANHGMLEAVPAGKFQGCLLRFLGKIDELYRPEIVYHNGAHAADVVATMEWFLRSEYMRTQISTLDHLMSTVAAAVHDVGHPGRNNLFLTKTMAPLAVTYNDKSILENMHCATTFEAMQADPATNWFSLLPGKHESAELGHAHDLQQYVRRGLIDMVLGTDMALHAEHVRKIEGFVEEQQEEALEVATPRKPSSKQEALEKKLLLLHSMLHAADISNPCKPHSIMMRWTEMVCMEFWEQGDEERSLGVEISPLCDRDTGRKTVPKGQIGFINFVVRPFFQPIAELIPEVQVAVEELAKNRAFWEEKDSEQAGFETLFPKAPVVRALANS